jgi:Flp pilus assembly protein TadD
MFLPPMHLGLLYSQLGRTDDAVRTLELAVAISGRHPWTLVALAICHSAQGERAKAEAIRDELVARARREYVQSCMLAVLTALLGDMDGAFTFLERACDEHDGILVYAKRYPFFGVLQADQRMAGILRRVGFPESP